MQFQRCEPAPRYAVAFQFRLAAFKGIKGNIFQKVRITLSLTALAVPFLDRVQSLPNERPLAIRIRACLFQGNLWKSTKPHFPPSPVYCDPEKPLRPPPRGEAALETVHYRAEAIRERLEAVWARERGPEDAGQAVQLTSRAMRPSRNTFPTVNAAFNSLEPGADQRPHRHNGVAVTLPIECENVHSLIEGERIDWSPGAAQITPATELHSHHNRGSSRMLSLVVQDEGLHYYTRTPGFSWA